MAHETKEERIVRSMVPQLTEHLIELRNLSSTSSKESEVETWCQSLIKSVLGFSASSGFQVRSQETRGKMRFDLVISRADAPDQILLVVEIKKLGANLNKSDLRSGKTQLVEYLKAVGDVRWGILTNGYEWRLYDFKNDIASISSIDIRNDTQEVDTTPKGILEAAWELLDFSSHFYEKKIWEKLSVEAKALSPDSLARSILTFDITKKIAKALNQEHGYRVSADLLMDKLAELLEEGLNDLLGSWNDSQRAELERYIRGQKRQAKKGRRKKTESPAHEEQILDSQSSVTEPKSEDEAA